MSVIRLFAILFIIACTTAAWFILGGALTHRTASRAGQMQNAVADVWGPRMTQSHPSVYHMSPAGKGARKYLQPKTSRIDVNLQYEPKKKGLLWYRTYVVDFAGTYEIENATPITQTIYVSFQFPAEKTSYYDFSLSVGDKVSTRNTPTKGSITEAVVLKPQEVVPLRVTYRSRGMDTWSYVFVANSRVRNFELTMNTDFREINFPARTGSPTRRKQTDAGWDLAWSYPDVIAAQSAGMDMPNVLNPGPVAARITFFAPVSLVFFFSVLLIVGMVRRVDLHPMNYFFLAAGCFAFQLLFAYTVDLMPILGAFLLASAVSLVLVSGYVLAAAGPRFASVAAVAQLAYMVLFSYSFFFDGLTGLTITIGAIVTLAVLMWLTAKVDWSEKFKRAERGARTVRPGSATASA